MNWKWLVGLGVGGIAAYFLYRKFFTMTPEQMEAEAARQAFIAGKGREPTPDELQQQIDFMHGIGPRIDQPTYGGYRTAPPLQLNNQPDTSTTPTGHWDPSGAWVPGDTAAPQNTPPRTPKTLPGPSYGTPPMLITTVQPFLNGARKG